VAFALTGCLNLGVKLYSIPSEDIIIPLLDNRIGDTGRFCVMIEKTTEGQSRSAKRNIFVLLTFTNLFFFTLQIEIM